LYSTTLVSQCSTGAWASPIGGTASSICSSICWTSMKVVSPPCEQPSHV
jgi:hypothetical protein